MKTALVACNLLVFVASASAPKSVPQPTTSSRIATLIKSAQRATPNEFVNSVEALARTLPAERIAAKREGIPLSISEMQGAHLSPQDDAAPDYVRLTQILKARPIPAAEEGVCSKSLREPLAPADWVALQSLLKRRSDVVTLAHKAAAKRGCNFHRNWSLGPTLEFPEYTYMRQAIRLITAESILMAHEGRPAEGLQNLEAGFRIAQHAGADRFLIGYLVEAAGHAITLRGLQVILRSQAPQEAYARQARALLEHYPAQPDLLGAMRFELGVDVVTLQSLRTGDMRTLSAIVDDKPGGQVPVLNASEQRLYQRLIDAWEADTLHFGRQILAAAQAPSAHRLSEYRKLQNYRPLSEDPLHAWRVLALPYPESLEENLHRQLARHRTTRMGIEVLLVRATSGSFPTELPSSAEASDPYNGRSLGYRREGKGFVVYSVGKDGNFNGGTPESEKTDRKDQSFFRHPGP